MTKKLSSCFQKGLVALAAAAVCSSAFAAGVWRVATEGTFPPFEFYNSKTGEIQGFEVDLVKAMAGVMDKELKLQTMSFDAIIPAMISGTIDAGAAGFSITPERAKKVSYTVPFYESGLTIVVPKENKAGISDFKDLEGKRIAVQLGTTSMTYAKKIKGAEITTFNSAGDAILSTLAGNADAVINDKPVTDYILSQSKDMNAKCTHLAPMATADQFAMITTKENKALADEMSAALKKLKADGTFDKLHEKWFGKPSDGKLP